MNDNTYEDWIAEKWMIDNADASKGFIEEIFHQFADRSINIDALYHTEPINVENLKNLDVLYFEDGFVGLVIDEELCLTITDKGLTSLEYKSDKWKDKITAIRRP